MKTETQVAITLGDLRAQQSLSNDPDGFIIKIFLSSSRTTSKSFRLSGATTPINQSLKIANISAKELQFWLCNQQNKIIANTTVIVPAEVNESRSLTVDFKMTSTALAELDVTLTVSKRQIEKILYVEPDQELLKRVQDPYEKLRKEEEQLQRQKQLEEQQKAAKQVKKAAITITKYNKKDIPFI